jgi:hypothetical protein
MLPRTTPDQRARFYEDVESLLSPGFLTHTVMVKGVRLHLRTLGTGDLFMLRARTEGATVHDWRVWAVATAIWMIDGRSVLGQDDAIPFLADYLRKLPKTAMDVLFSIVLGLWIRMSDAAEAVEVYCYELGSRYKWRMLGSAGLLHSGVPRAELLGRNIVQNVWTAFNEMEDTKRSEETAWEGFKLVASSNAPKAIKKMDSNDARRREAEQKDREKKLDQFYYWKLGLVDRRGVVEGADGSMHRLQGSKSVEDLEDEMRRWVTEDYDLHDKIVAEYKAKIRAKHEAERQAREVHRQALQRKREELGWETGSFKPQPLIGLTAEQLQHHLAQQGRLGAPNVTFIPAAPDQERVYDKFVVGEAATGNLMVQDGKVVDPHANEATDKRTLNELISGRNPAFGTGE